MFKANSLFYTDGYKIGHKRMLAKGTTKLYGTWIPRSTKHAPKGINKILSFGQQLAMRWLHDEFSENFFKLSKEDAMQFGKDMSMYLGMDYDASHFEALYDLGYLPIRVKALPEGIETSPNIPHMTFINTVLIPYSYILGFYGTGIRSYNKSGGNQVAVRCVAGP